MDPLSHGTLGAICGGVAAGSRRNELRVACVTGLLAGLVPDLDVLIRSQSDPLLNIEYHRQFTHSLAFAPILALLPAAVVFGWLRWRSAGRQTLSFFRLYLFACISLLSHGLLDAGTSYGTQLYWPWSNQRVAWSVVAIVDPLFTVPLIGILLWAFWKKSFGVARLGLGFALLYLFFGYTQHQRALSTLEQIVLERGHSDGATRLEVKTSVLNNVLWRTLYTYEGYNYVDAVNVFPGLTPKVYPGGRAPLWEPDVEIPAMGLPETSVLARDIRRFHWFSAERLALDFSDKAIVSDLRYSMLPNRLDPLWGIRIDPLSPEQHVRFETFRRSDLQTRDTLFSMIFRREIPL